MEEITSENKKTYCSEDIANVSAVDIDEITVTKKIKDVSM